MLGGEGEVKIQSIRLSLKNHLRDNAISWKEKYYSYIAFMHMKYKLSY